MNLTVTAPSKRTPSTTGGSVGALVGSSTSGVGPAAPTLPAENPMAAAATTAGQTAGASPPATSCGSPCGGSSARRGEPRRGTVERYGPAGIAWVEGRTPHQPRPRWWCADAPQRASQAAAPRGRAEFHGCPPRRRPAYTRPTREEPVLPSVPRQCRGALAPRTDLQPDTIPAHTRRRGDAAAFRFRELRAHPRHRRRRRRQQRRQPDDPGRDDGRRVHRLQHGRPGAPAVGRPAQDPHRRQDHPRPRRRRRRRASASARPRRTARRSPRRSATRTWCSSPPASAAAPARARHRSWPRSPRSSAR